MARTLHLIAKHNPRNVAVDMGRTRADPFSRSYRMMGPDPPRSPRCGDWSGPLAPATVPVIPTSG